MRISPMPRVCSGLLCGFSLVLAGCSNPSSQTLASLAITATPSTLSVGGAAVLKATAHLSDGTTQDVTSGTLFTLSNSSLATVSNGAVTAKAAGSVTIQGAYVEATPAGSSPAAASTTPLTLNASTQVTITAAGTTNVPAIQWTAPAAITYGTALSSTQLDATANVAGTFTYLPATGTVLTAGTQTLSATFTPADKTYSAAIASVPLTVAQATPVVTWTAPASIATGTTLSVTQLNATANIPGSFAYNPAAGAILAAGTQPLTAVFSPTDTTDYVSTTAHNSITVSTPTNPPTNPPTGPPTNPPSNPPTNPPSNPVGGPSLPAPASCGGPTINLNAGMSQSTLQSDIANAPNCSLIIFAAGTYNLNSKLVIPCNNLQITGPVASTPTAILAASFQSDSIFYYKGGCANVGSIEYLHFENTGAIYLAPGNNSNLTVAYILVTNLPSMVTKAGGIFSTTESGVFLDGGASNTTSNVLIEYNTFGDSNSCAAAFATAVDEGGSCAGVLTHAGKIQNLTINYNKFFHVEEGIHILEQIAWKIGGPTSVCISCVMDYNYVLNYHRIGVEVQVSTPTNAIMFEHNSVVDPINSSWGTYALSFACCQNGYITGQAGASPSLIVNDNVLVSTLPIGTSKWPPPFAVEFWGTGSIGENNVIGGTFSNGFVWGYGGGNWQINNNYICGANMANKSLGNAFILNEESQKNPPSQSGNVTSPTCSATASKAPVISPAGGSFSGSQTVSLSDPGSNTSIWFTTDGSMPVPGAGTAQLYSAPFSVTANTTVKAVGMWGNANQPTSYPAGYGYSPSGVVTASFVSSSVVRRPGAQLETMPGSLQGQSEPLAGLRSLNITSSTSELVIGGNAQLRAVAIFEDGSTRDVTSETAWRSSDIRTIAVATSGQLNGLAAGTALISGGYRGIQKLLTIASGVGERVWSNPIVISHGGVYSGSWQSLDPGTAAVTITTAEPVIIEDAHIRSVAHLIEVKVAGADVTVRNSVGVAGEGYSSGAFLDVQSPARLDVENNYVDGVRGGVLVHGFSGNPRLPQTLVIRANRVRNLNRLGGIRVGKKMDRSASQFVDLEDVHAVAGVDVGWNEVIDYPGQSLVGIVINIYRSSGTANNPLDIHDSYIQGAYPAKPTKDAYSGGGIRTDGQAEDTAESISAFAYIHDNQVVSTGSYGIAFAAGHDHVAANNRVLSSGLLSDGTKIAVQGVGLSNSSRLGSPQSDATYNNTTHDNLVGWACWTGTCSTSHAAELAEDRAENTWVLRDKSRSKQKRMNTCCG